MVPTGDSEIVGSVLFLAWLPVVLMHSLAETPELARYGGSGL